MQNLITGTIQMMQTDDLFRYTAKTTFCTTTVFLV